MILEYDNLTTIPIDLNSNQYYGVAMKKGNRTLKKAVDRIIYELHSSGEYEELFSQYLQRAK